MENQLEMLRSRQERVIMAIEQGCPLYVTPSISKQTIDRMKSRTRLLYQLSVVFSASLELVFNWTLVFNPHLFFVIHLFGIFQIKIQPDHYVIVTIDLI